MTIHTHSVYSAVGAQLERLFNTEDWDELRIYLGRLSHKDFQTAGKIIGETLLPSVDENKFWAAFYCLIDFHPKAFLMTMLKAIPKRYNNKTFNLRHNGFIVVSNYLNTKNATIDKEKIIRFMLNVLDNPDDIDYLFTRFKIDTPKDKLEYLLRGRTMAAYFVMFKTLREVEHDRSLLNRCAVFLRKQDDTMAYNFVSLMKSYFDLREIKGSFSLQLNPYELGRAETSYDSFMKLLEKFKS